MEDELLPMQHVPPLHVTDGSKGTAELLHFGTSAVAGAARAMLYLASNCLRGSDSGFILRVFSRSLSCVQVCRKAAEVWDQGFPPLDGLPSQADGPRLPRCGRSEVTYILAVAREQQKVFVYIIGV